MTEQQILTGVSEKISKFAIMTLILKIWYPPRSSDLAKEFVENYKHYLKKITQTFLVIQIS